MNITSIIGKKIDQTQGFLEDGKRVPLSIINVAGNVVSQVKTQDHEGYDAIQLGFGNAKRVTKPMAGHIKKAGLRDTSSPRFFRENRLDDGAADVEVGAQVEVAQVFEPGDIVDVTGTSKGKGYAGVVKRYRFAGGPKTHGQSDRHRARGSSGSGTTPGRVYKGKKMSGRMGNEQVTVKNLEVLGIDGDTLLVRGLVPGIKGAVVVVKKVGKNKKFVPLWSEKVEVVEEVAPTEEAAAPVEEVKTAEEVVETPEETVETASETVETADETVKTAEEVVETPEETKEEEKTEEAKEEVKEGEQNA